ncbi:MAG: MBL fold metallo-hydrolase [Syntrophomonas sp.]|uniref:MBL fold metallo-hydrolase n=1 Tax=Syntrophomonas sp. TaxID=2053627 RepID=UPI0026371F7D|nr:MBL fold metallo-hydrolase [Syntrophomonas sp.]MDD2510563.1 MBL fold metallo-hydrolase [Syntrophomonas sp.]MDD3878844.1 MBL fold metallo-hydrolase [Syntrophomonas sp.]MDD4626686.1 MBL fold metallo-hydrolase [Syntrophomonas sp.]
MNVTVSILVENTTPSPSLVGEYGFSALIEVDGRKILFDTGSRNALFNNAENLGIKLEEVEALVISHGHFDHTSAVVPFLQRFGPKKLYLHPGIFTRRFLQGKKGLGPNIGCPFDQEELVENGAKIIFIDSFCEIMPGIFISGEIPRKNSFENTGGNFKIATGHGLVEDKLPDDMALLVDHPEGLIIISGCAHSGMINTIEYLVEKTGRSKMLAFIGGTHLITASEDRLAQTIAALKTINVEKIAVGHCTGFYAAARLLNELGPRVIKADTGMSFHF